MMNSAQIRNELRTVIPSQSIAGAAARQGHVQSQMERQGSLIGHIAERLGELEARLQPILRSEPQPPTSGMEGCEKMLLVGHANALSNQNDQLERVDAVLAGIIDRIEL